MPSCVIKGCKNYDTKVKKQHGISYHRFPNDPVRKEIWSRIIRKQRNEPYFKPHKNARVCSAHFVDKDFDISKAGLRRLKGSAIPRIGIEVPRAEPSDIGQPSGQQQREPSTSGEVHEWPDDAELNSDDDDEEVEQTLYDPPVPARAPAKKKKAPEEPSTVAEASGKEDAPAASSSRLHAGYRCDQCRGDIVGFRYCCVECANYDLCGACEAGGHHAAHYVLRVPSTKPHMEVLAVLENMRNFLLEKKEDENRCELEAEVKVEAPEPAPEPDPLAPPPDPSDDQEEEKFTIVEADFPEIPQPSEKRDILGDMVVKLELDEEDQQMTAGLPPAPAEPQVYSHTVRGAPVTKSNVKVYSGGGSAGSGSGNVSGSGGGGGEGFAVYTHSAARPAPDPGTALVPQGAFVTQEKGEGPSAAKRKTDLPPQHAKVKKK